MAKRPFVNRGVSGIGLCLLALLAARPLPAQPEPAPQTGGGDPAAAATTSPGQQPQAEQGPRVTGARSTNKENPTWAKLGDGLTVEMVNLRAAIESAGNRCDRLVLFLNEMPIKGVPPESCKLETGAVRFTLDRTDDSDRAWHALLEEPVALYKTISVSIGPDSSLSYPSVVVDFHLIVLPPVQLLAYFVTLIGFILLLIRLAVRTPLLRDRGASAPAGKLPPYSLARFQMAFWFLLVVAAYLFIWMITEELDTITGSVLALLGIGSATALGANLIDTAKPNAGAAAGGGDGAPSPPAPAPKPAKSAVSQGFLRDVLSDAEGISLYRFQLFVWTLVLGVIFVASVYDGLAMPQFNPTLLGLMGISSGTYLGFKVPESRTGTE
jgi:hypothetical protein